MQLLQKLLNKFNGLHYKQEYLCLAKESFQQPLHAYLVDNGRVIKDITEEHVFTGYSPLIFSISSNALPIPPGHIEIAFSQRSLQPNDYFKKKDALAGLSLEWVHQQDAGNARLFYYKGVVGQHHFISSFHQYIIALYNRLYNKKTGNVFLPGNLYKQIQVAYSLPRVISLITVSDGQLYNLFPTDLHGPINDQYYVSSLRHEGKACKQVEAAGRIVICQVHYSAYKTVYSLGKNHMQELKTKDSFPFGDAQSSLFQLPLPQQVLYYRELELLESFVHGIHKLLLYKIVSRHRVKEEPSTLAHIHNGYATWRHNKGLTGNYLLR
jgi:hypothetical protein